MDINSPAADDIRNYIRKARKAGVSWDDERLLLGDTEDVIQKNLERKKQDLFLQDDLTVDDWKRILVSEIKAENDRINIDRYGDGAIIHDPSEDNSIYTPTLTDSSWVKYVNHLIINGFSEEAIAEIEISTLRIIKRLSIDTQNSEPIKGLVVGHVQSGKTANMAALMAMAADWNWNLFIVLTGTIESLRVQTENRLLKDLRHPGILNWEIIKRPSRKSELADRTSQLNFSTESKNRYFTVCLKNKKRLSDLIDWLQHDKSKMAQMRIIVIDDESDQGSINTADVFSDERKAINRLIVNLVSGLTKQSRAIPTKYKSMNYVGYTATPYANFLNEAGRESLYPRNFIATLYPPREYFGPTQIFGHSETSNPDGLDIIRHVSNEDCAIIGNIQTSKNLTLPSSLIEAILWFVCSTAAMRLLGHKKPVSMLVHTSQRKEHHESLANAIQNWLSINSNQSIVERCKMIYEREIRRFSRSDFFNQFSNYCDNMTQINDYPNFDLIADNINTILNTISPVKLAETGSLSYHSGIHLCIDNSDNNGINSEGEHIRLAYPPSDIDPYPTPAPAFLVVGGTTISRGLTLEGLVSSFFLRASTQADTLMQMGRWFGFRRGYEIFPRIWLTEDTHRKYIFLTDLEYDLRKDLRKYMDLGVDPSQFGPRIKNSPFVTWLRITATKRMQGVVEADYDFSGSNSQTVVFHTEKSVLEHNIVTTDNFLKKLGNGEKSKCGNAIIWRGIDFETIRNDFLINFKFHNRSRVFNQINEFFKWFDDCRTANGFTNWNVVVSGTNASNKQKSKIWQLNGGEVGYINRSKQKKYTSNDSISIGVLRAPSDLMADSLCPLPANNKRNDWDRMRVSSELRLTPQLLLYRIDKDSQALKIDESDSISQINLSRTQREDLHSPADIIGVSIWIPGNSDFKQKGSHATKVTIDLSKFDTDYDSDIRENIYGN